MKNTFYTLEQLQTAKQILTHKSKEMPSRISQNQMITSLKKEIQKLVKNGWTLKEIVNILSDINVSVSLATLRKNLKNDDISC